LISVFSLFLVFNDDFIIIYFTRFSASNTVVEYSSFIVQFHKIASTTPLSSFAFVAQSQGNTDCRQCSLEFSSHVESMKTQTIQLE